MKFQEINGQTGDSRQLCTYSLPCCLRVKALLGLLSSYIRNTSSWQFLLNDPLVLKIRDALPQLHRHFPI